MEMAATASIAPLKAASLALEGLFEAGDLADELQGGGAGLHPG